MNTAHAQPLRNAGRAELAEGPVWDARLHRLYWVDIVGEQFHWLDRGATERSSFSLPGPVGFICLTEDPDTLIAGCGARVLSVDLASHRIETLLELAPPDSGLRCNDGKCDPTGRLWVGTMPMHPAAPRGALYSIDHDLTVRRHLSDLGCANGLAWNVTWREFYFTDTLTRRIDRHRWDPRNGALANAQPLAHFAEGDGLPDGMCIDDSGHLWVGFWDGGCVRQIDGFTGKVRTIIDLPVARVTSCTFGGDDLGTLFITTAATGLDQADRASQPLAGGVFSVRTGARGLPADCFRRHSTAVT